MLFVCGGAWFVLCLLVQAVFFSWTVIVLIDPPLSLGDVLAVSCGLCWCEFACLLLWWLCLWLVCVICVCMFAGLLVFFVCDLIVCVCVLVCVCVCVCTLSWRACACQISSFGVILVVGAGWVLVLVCLVVCVSMWGWCLGCPLYFGASLLFVCWIVIVLVAPLLMLCWLLLVVCVGVSLPSCCFGGCACGLFVSSASVCLLACLDFLFVL